MTDLTDSDKSKIMAETARKNMASRVPIAEILERVERWNGSGLTPGEVLALVYEIKKLRGES